MPKNNKKTATINSDQLKEIIENTSDLVSLHNAKGEYIYASPSCKNLLGYSQKDLIGTSAYKYFKKEDIKKISRHHQNNKKGINPDPVRYRIKTKLGKYIWVETKSTGVLSNNGKKLKSIVAITRNIEDVVKVESDLAKAKQVFEEAFKNSPIGMALVSIKGKFLKVNSSLCTLLGFSENELLKKDFQQITHKDDLKKDLSYVKKLLNREISSYKMEKRYITKNKKVVWVQLNGSLVVNSKKEPQFFIAQIQNITARKRSDNLSQNQMESLERMNRLMVNRELKMIELKNKIKKLKQNKK